MNKKILFGLLLIVLLLTSGCMKPRAEAPVEEVESAVEPVEIEETPLSTETPAEEVVEEISEESIEETVQEAPATQVVTTPTITNEITIGSGKMPAMTIYNNELQIAWSSYTGESWDVIHTTFDGTSIGEKAKIAETPKEDYFPTLVTHREDMYLLWNTVSDLLRETMMLNYKKYNGSAWLDEKEVKDLEYGPHMESSAAVHNNRVYVFWTYGLEVQKGKIYTRKFDGQNWMLGPVVTLSTLSNEKDARIVEYNDGLSMIFESYTGDKNDIYYRSFKDDEWSSAFKISETDKPKVKDSGAIAVLDETLYAAWEAEDELYLRSFDGTDWSEITQLTDNDYEDSAPALAVFNDKLYLAWTSYETGHPYAHLGEVSTYNP